jgi:Ni/Co efflux regulator RcnB
LRESPHAAPAEKTEVSGWHRRCPWNAQETLMATRNLLTALALTAIVATPAIASAAQQRQRGRDSQHAQRRERAVPRNDNRRYDNRDNNRRHYISHPVIVRPTIVRVVPYRPYRYRPSYSIGEYYGAGGSYPYGYTPRGYYDPLPGVYYGGVRITGAPRDARVFADGYYVGIVNDFDGIFQHMNLEAGPHHIEIEVRGSQGIAFDVYVRPGETTTFRADGRY